MTKHELPEVSHLDFHSGVSAFTGEPFIAMEVAFADGSRRTTGQLTPVEARQHALAVLEAAEAAVHDAAVAGWLCKRMGLEQEAMGHVLQELRVYRQDQQEGGPADDG